MLLLFRHYSGSNDQSNALTQPVPKSNSQMSSKTHHPPPLLPPHNVSQTFMNEQISHEYVFVESHVTHQPTRMVHRQGILTTSFFLLRHEIFSFWTTDGSFVFLDEILFCHCSFLQRSSNTSSSLDIKVVCYLTIRIEFVFFVFIRIIVENGSSFIRSSLPLSGDP